MKEYEFLFDEGEIRKLESVACFKKTMFAKIFKEQQCLHHFII